MFECDFCGKEYSTYSSLNLHQKTTKKCLEIQGNNTTNNIKTFTCECCNKIFLAKQILERHNNTCKYKHVKVETECQKLKEEIEKLKQENKILKEQLEKTKKELNTLKNKEVRNNYNIKFKNEFDKLLRFTKDNVKASLLNHLTINSIKGGEDRYINDVVDGIKKFIIVKDLARCKVIIKDEQGKEYKTTSNKVVQQSLIFIKEEQYILLEQVKQSLPDFDSTNIIENGKINMVINSIIRLQFDVEKEKTNIIVNDIANKLTKEGIIIN
jgi:hypothetical protein